MLSSDYHADIEMMHVNFSFSSRMLFLFKDYILQLSVTHYPSTKRSRTLLSRYLTDVLDTNQPTIKLHWNVTPRFSYLTLQHPFYQLAHCTWKRKRNENIDDRNRQIAKLATLVPLDLFERLEPKPATWGCTRCSTIFFWHTSQILRPSRRYFGATCSQRHRQTDQSHYSLGGSWQARAFLEGAFNDLVVWDGSDH